MTQKVQWAARVEQRFDEFDFRGSALGGSRRTFAKCIPVLKLLELGGTGNVLIARGNGMEIWRSDHSGTMRGADVRVEGARGTQVGRKEDGRSALEAITSVVDGTRDGELVVSRVNGAVQRLTVVHDGRERGGSVMLKETARYSPAAGGEKGAKTNVQALASSGGMLASAATHRHVIPSTVTPPSSGASTPVDGSLAASLSRRAVPTSYSVSLYNLNSPWEVPTTIPFARKPWSVLLSPTTSSAPTWLAVGHTGTRPLSLVHLTPSGPLTSSIVNLAHSSRSTSVYGLTTPSLTSSPFAHPSQTLIATFFDSTTRIYDLRIAPPSSSSLPTSFDDDPSSRPANEVLRLSDPWSDDAGYAVSCGGPGGAYVAVGTARNANVRLFDVRSPRTGITAYAPEQDRSPVYSVAMEGSRIWGVTESRGFGLDWDGFGPMGESVGYVSHVKRGGGNESRGGELRQTGRRN